MLWIRTRRGGDHRSVMNSGYRRRAILVYGRRIRSSRVARVHHAIGILEGIGKRKIRRRAYLLDATSLGLNLSAHDLGNASPSELKELGVADGSALFLGFRQLVKKPHRTKKRI